MKLISRLAAFAVLVQLLGCGRAAAPPTAPAKPTEAKGEVEVKQLEEIVQKRKPLHERLGKPEAGDWLAVHHEAGQSFEEYKDSQPRRVDKQRRVIYIQPLGEYTDEQREIVALTADFMGRYFGLPVKTRETIPLSVIPDSARRVHPQWGVKQILSTYVLYDVLKPRLPDDAIAYIGLTGMDLWPGRGWNFVFGQASLRERVGVWSLYRNGNPTEGREAFRTCLLRTIKTATHEMGHMLSMQHCTAYRCAMNGSNSLQEKDERPPALGPQCLAKLCWATGAEPAERYRKLATFCRENGLKPQADFYEKSIVALNNEADDAARQDGAQ